MPESADEAPPDIRLGATETTLDPAIAARIAEGEHEMRRALASGILRVFVVGNLAVWIVVLILVAIDVSLILAHLQRPGERVIDQGVIKTLVGATAVQVGIIMVTIAGNLFPHSRRPWWKFWR